MGVSAVLNQVETMCEAITGVVNVVQGSPDDMPGDINQYPYVVLTVINYRAKKLTMGVSGLVREDYDVIITVYLGGADMSSQDAQATAVPLYPRFRAKFTPDH